MLRLLSEEEVIEDYVLSKIIRYNTRRKLQQESVAEHSFFVTLFCVKLLKQLNLTPEEERDVLIVATLHDVAEKVTSDVPYDVKQRNARLKEMLKLVEDNYYNEEWGEYAYLLDDENSLPVMIMKLADSYSVLQYAINELSLGNNSKDMKLILDDAKCRIQHYTDNINNIVV